MKHPILILAAVLMVSLVAAQLNPAVAGGKTHDVSATIVAVDAQGKKITFQDDAGATSTATVMEKAVESLKSVKAGDKVVLTCRDTDAGTIEGVIAIKAAPAGKS